MRITPGRAAAVVVVVAVAALVVVVSRDFLYLDDFVAEAQAAQHPLDWSYLTQPVFGHLVVGWRLVFWAAERSAPLRWWPMASVIVVSYAAVLVGFYRLVVACIGRRWSAVVALVVVAASPALAPTELWAANALHEMTSLACTLWALERFVSHLRDRRPTQLVAAVILEALGLAFYEKPLLLVVFAPLLIAVLAIPGRRTLGAIGRALWSARRPVIVLWAPLVAFAVAYLAAGEGRDVQRPGVAFTARAVGRAWTHAIGPALIGGPFHWLGYLEIPVPVAGPSRAVEVLAQALLVAAAVITIARHRWALRGWVFAVVTAGISFAVVALGRLTFYGLPAASDVRYTADAIPFVVLGVVLAVAPTEPQLAGALRTEPTPATAPRGRHRALPLATVAALAAYLVAAGVSLHRFEAGWRKPLPSEYVSTLRQDIAGLQRAGRPFSLFDTAVNPGVATAFLYPYDRVLALAATFAPGLHYNDPALPSYVVDPATGRVRPAVLQRLRSASISPSQGCLGPLHPQVTIPLGPRLPTELYLAEVTASSGQGQLDVSPSSANPYLALPGPRSFPSEAPGVDRSPLQLRAGDLGVVSLIEEPLDGVSLRLRSGSVCVAAVAIDVPVPAPPG